MTESLPPVPERPLAPPPFPPAPGQPAYPAAPPPPPPYPALPHQGVPGHWAPYQGMPAPLPAPPKRSRTGLIVGIAVGVVVLLAMCVVGGVFLIRAVGNAAASDATRAETGLCLAGTTPEELNADDLKIVDCTHPSASFRVVETVEDTLFENAEAACTHSSTEFYFWSGVEGRKGRVLCLAEITG